MHYAHVHDSRAWGEHLAEIRRNAGLTQVDVAERSGIDQGTISRWEQGKRVPDIAQVTRLAEALGCTIADLLINGNGEAA
jgi:transcriptional regulator with XRE-family HTH domain